MYGCAHESYSWVLCVWRVFVCVCWDVRDYVCSCGAMWTTSLASYHSTARMQWVFHTLHHQFMRICTKKRDTRLCNRFDWSEVETQTVHSTWSRRFELLLLCWCEHPARSPYLSTLSTTEEFLVDDDWQCARGNHDNMISSIQTHTQAHTGILYILAPYYTRTKAKASDERVGGVVSIYINIHERWRPTGSAGLIHILYSSTSTTIWWYRRGGSVFVYAEHRSRASRVILYLFHSTRNNSSEVGFFVCVWCCVYGAEHRCTNRHTNRIVIA